MGIKDEEGMSQILDKIEQMNQQQRVQVNQQINLTVNPSKKEAEQKLESFVRQMSYDDIRAFVEYHKHKDEAVEVEFKEGNSEKD
jgi:CHASE3 domain sensor protein